MAQFIVFTLQQLHAFQVLARVIDQAAGRLRHPLHRVNQQRHRLPQQIEAAHAQVDDEHRQ